MNALDIALLEDIDKLTRKVAELEKDRDYWEATAKRCSVAALHEDRAEYARATAGRTT
jgi:hypothetical protein